MRDDRNQPPKPPKAGTKPKKRRKRGRPRGPCNARELAQRRAAAWKHGQTARGLARVVPPCKKSTCRLEFPCSVKEHADAKGTALGRCVVTLAVDEAVRDAYRRALDGDPAALAEHNATAMATLYELHRDELARLRHDGFVLETPIYGEDDDGNPVELGTAIKVNPAVKPFLELNRQLGYTGQEQVLTPRSRGEDRAHRSFASHLDALGELRRRLGEGDE